jgi:hypothetical protein
LRPHSALADLFELFQVMEMCEAEEAAGEWLAFLNCYTCMDPEGTFIWMWTITYVVLILYIATWGLFQMAFLPEPPDCTPLDWFEFGVDTFFVIDIFCRAFIFGTIIERAGFFSDSSEVVREPDRVLKRYVMTGALAVDIVTGIPYSWISMSLGCGSDKTNVSDMRILRIVRATRVSRILKIFQQPQARKAMRRLKESIGNNHALKLVSLLCMVVILNHMVTCFAWLVQMEDLTDRNGITGFEEFQDSIGIDASSDSSTLKYSLMFMITMQSLFAIEPSEADTVLEAWFGVLVLVLSVCVHATIVTYVIQIWESINHKATQMEERINSVISFLRTNGIDGDLRSEVCMEEEAINL